MQLTFRRVDWTFKAVFRIAYRTQAIAETLQVELQDGQWRGRGEGLPIAYRQETAESMAEVLKEVDAELKRGVDIASVLSRLSPGGARNALDCALWDLHAKREGRRAWELAGISTVHPLRTAYTLGIDEPEALARSALDVPSMDMLKLKLAGDGRDVERVKAVRRARHDVNIIVDANQSWDERQLRENTPALAELGVALIEQPLPASSDEALSHFESPVPLCADESFQTSASIQEIRGKYEYVNIKLDKTGGLTEALRAAADARVNGLKVMIGCMGGSSLSMAPAFIIGQLSSVVDLDGPLILTNDLANRIEYQGSLMFPPDRALWG